VYNWYLFTAPLKQGMALRARMAHELIHKALVTRMPFIKFQLEGLPP